jgi:hypothetical protein
MLCKLPCSLLNQFLDPPLNHYHSRRVAVMREAEGNILHPYSARSLPLSIVASAGQPLRFLHPQQHHPKFYPFINRNPTVHRRKKHRDWRSRQTAVRNKQATADFSWVQHQTSRHYSTLKRKQLDSFFQDCAVPWNSVWHRCKMTNICVKKLYYTPWSWVRLEKLWLIVT